MKEEINEEVRQLLESLEEHGKNTRRQAQLSDLIDELAAKEKTVEMPQKRRKLVPLWWAMGAAAACLLLWLLVKPASKQTHRMNEKNLVEKTETIDTIQIKKDETIFEAPVAEEKLLAEETSPPGLLRCARNDESPKPKKETAQQNLLAENTTTEPVESQESTDTTNIGSNNIPAESETPSAVQSPRRRVIRSLNLVCYECQKEPEHEIGIKPNMDNKTLFGQPQDPNMKNGALAVEFKLN